MEKVPGQIHADVFLIFCHDDEGGIDPAPFIAFNKKTVLHILTSLGAAAVYIEHFHDEAAQGYYQWNDFRELRELE
jgi:hypothetical protein